MVTRQRDLMVARGGVVVVSAPSLGETSSPGIGFANEGVGPKDKADTKRAVLVNVVKLAIIVGLFLLGAMQGMQHGRRRRLGYAQKDKQILTDFSLS